MHPWPIPLQLKTFLFQHNCIKLGKEAHAYQLFDKSPKRTHKLVSMGIPWPFRALLVAGVTLTGGVFALSLVSTVTLGVVRSAVEASRKKSSKPCEVCKRRGAYSCKLCKGNGTIEWSPMYDPIAINPCQCPTCEGRCIQGCLNCLGKGYYI